MTALPSGGEPVFLGRGRGHQQYKTGEIHLFSSCLGGIRIKRGEYTYFFFLVKGRGHQQCKTGEIHLFSSWVGEGGINSIKQGKYPIYLGFSLHGKPFLILEKNKELASVSKGSESLIKKHMHSNRAIIIDFQHHTACTCVVTNHLA